MPAELVSLSSSTDRSYPVYFESVENLPSRMIETVGPPGRCFVVTDENVSQLYRKDIDSVLRPRGFDPSWLTIPAGEDSKSSNIFNTLCTEFLEAGIERKTPVLAFGGGVVGDVTGFAAASVLRGVPLVHVPTSLVAQVDSSIGGKTGINHKAGKNLLGAFYQPRLILSDVSFLTSLPPREWHGGLAEVVKHALISDRAFFHRLKENWTDVLNLPSNVSEWLVPAAARVKINIVSDDEKEQGIREHLNFGHTFGHALELLSGYGSLSHGEAVAHGMYAALLLSARLYPSSDFSAAMEMVSAIPRYGNLPITTSHDCVEAMRSDKKVRDRIIRVVVLEDVGRARVRADVAESELQACWDEVLANQ